MEKALRTQLRRTRSAGTTPRTISRRANQEFETYSRIWFIGDILQQGGLGPILWRRTSRSAGFWHRQTWRSAATKPDPNSC